MDEDIEAHNVNVSNVWELFLTQLPLDVHILMLLVLSNSEPQFNYPQLPLISDISL